MPNIDPRILLIFCLLFVGLAVFNLYLGIKRLRQAHAQGEKLRWYKQLSILTGIEYVLLALAFVGSLSISNGWLPGNIRAIIFPFYLLMLLFAAILAAVVVYQNSKKGRLARTAGGAYRAEINPAPATSSAQIAQRQTISEEEREDALQRRRERRQKAAAARRRRAGKA
jgi:hypothetical protein